MAPAAVRPAEQRDAGRLAELASQLGYPSTAEEVERRLGRLRDEADAVLMVATRADDRPIGWIHVALKPSLVHDASAQVMGLVVDEAARGSGVGAALLDRAEAWAAERGCRELVVATRVTRERAHRFYRRQGYALLKTSHMFRKPLL